MEIQLLHAIQTSFSGLSFVEAMGFRTVNMSHKIGISAGFEPISPASPCRSSLMFFTPHAHRIQTSLAIPRKCGGV